MPYGSKLHIPPTIYHLLAAQHTSPLGVGVEKWGERETDRERERELYLEFVSRFSLTNRVMLIVHCSVHNRSSLNANVWYTWYYFTNARPPTPPSTPSPTPSFLFVCLFVCMLYWFTHSSRQATALGKIGQHWLWTVVVQKKKNATTNVNM